MEGLSKPVIVIDAFGERSMKRGYLIDALPQGMTPWTYAQLPRRSNSFAHT
jgi:hypothetical protein